VTLTEARRALYQAAPGEFVARRKELSAALRSGGDTAGATLLAASPKPSAHAWLANRLFADGALDDAFRAGEASRAAQAALMRGEIDPAGARRAAEAHAAALAVAVLRAEPAPPATLVKLRALLSAVTLRGSFAPYEPGCLAGDVELPSLEELAIGLVASPPAPPEPAPTAAPPDAERARAARVVAATSAWERAGDAQRAERAALDAAVVERDAAAREVGAARLALTEAEARLLAREAALTDREASLASSDQELARAAEALEAARTCANDP